MVTMVTMTETIPRFRTLTLVMLVMLGLGTVWAVPASGQEPFNQPPPAASIRFGPLYLQPALEVREVGVDSNVNNDTTQPVDDFTATINPQLVTTLLMGRARLTGTTSADYVHYATLKDQRSVNSVLSGRVDLFLNRVHPWATVDYVKTRERVGLEIDKRARRQADHFAGGVDLRIGSRMALSVTAQRQLTNYDAGETFRGVDLGQSLNGAADSMAVAIRRVLTPLTTFQVEVEVQRDRFDFETIRNADSIRVAPGLALSPDALISGEVSVGYRSFVPRSDQLPPYRGLVASVEADYRLLERTVFTVKFDRDVAYSFEPDRPYYLSTGTSVGVTQRVFGPFELVVSAAHHGLDYRLDQGSPGTGARTDTVRVTGGGLGYYIGETTRVGVNVEVVSRRSSVDPASAFERAKVFASVSYGR